MEFNLMTSNIRFENEADGENNWPKRRSIWKNIIKDHCVDILCTQEGRKGQIHNANEIIDLKLIDQHREWIPERMYPCIFINKDKFTVIESGDFWLSDTPDIAGSKSFGSAFPRLCTWLKLDMNNNLFYVFNCHLDHVLDETRSEQSKVIISQIKQINTDKIPYILAGDFNESPNETVRKNINKHLKLNDPLYKLNEEDQGTHHRFDGNNQKSSRIDWIMTEKSFSCLEYKIIKEHENGRYPSDHFPVFATLTL